MGGNQPSKNEKRRPRPRSRRRRRRRRRSILQPGKKHRGKKVETIGGEKNATASRMGRHRAICFLDTPTRKKGKKNQAAENRTKSYLYGHWGFFFFFTFISFSTVLYPMSWGKQFQTLSFSFFFFFYFFFSFFFFLFSSSSSSKQPVGGCLWLLKLPRAYYMMTQFEITMINPTILHGILHLLEE